MNTAAEPATIIRTATHDDVPRIVQLGCRFLTESGYAEHLTPDPIQMTATMEWLLSDPARVIFLSEVDGLVTGGIGLFVYTHPMSGLLTGVECFWYVAPEHRGHGKRLLERAESWAKDHGATTLQMVAPTPEIEHFYVRRGYAKVETTYSKGL